MMTLDLKEDEEVKLSPLGTDFDSEADLFDFTGRQNLDWCVGCFKHFDNT
jgi:hypothetical protein